MRKHFIGIDPGKSGAVAIIPVIDGKVLDVSVTDIPILKADKGTKASYDPAAMARLLLNATDNADELHVFIEQVHSMPGQGVASMFDFGKGYGIWLGILAAVQMPYTIVTPQRWKKAMLSDMKQDKSASRGRASQLFPAISDRFEKIKDDGRAEALLIAEYGRRLETV